VSPHNGARYEPYQWALDRVTAEFGGEDVVEGEDPAAGRFSLRVSRGDRYAVIVLVQAGVIPDANQMSDEDRDAWLRREMARVHSWLDSPGH
jgi:hypothetical protein